MRASSASSDMAYLNGLFRPFVRGGDGHFVDIWNGFTDEDGRFVTSGPDVEGQVRQLRTGDGINFTRAGRLKLAFYVERQIKQMFGDAASSLLTVLAPESYPTLRLPPLQPEEDLVRIDPIQISDPELDGGASLLGDVNAVSAIGPDNPLLAKSPRDRLVEDGVSPPAKPGRANNFSWPPT